MLEAEEKLSRRHYQLFAFLGVATFFEGYDQIALSQILPEFRADMGLDQGDGGLIVGFINFGTILAYFLVRRADSWGRRRVLAITILGYTLFTFLTALSPNVAVFVVCQFLARIFLIAEWAVSMVYAAEEFPASKRGLMIGLIQAFSSLGSVVCAGLASRLVDTPLGWRTVYLAGTVPLLLLAFARRSLKESRRFSALDDAERAPRSLFEILRSPYRKRVLQLALIWGLTYICTQTAVTFWKEYAIAPPPASGPHLSAHEIAAVIALGAVIAMPLVFGVGKLIDMLGRRRGAVVIFIATAIACVAAYTVTERGPLMTAAVVGAIFGASAVLPVLNAFNTELFPTRLRGDAFAWSNNLLGRLGYVAAPMFVGFGAEAFGWGPAVAVTAVGPLLALALILTWLPETASRDLDETSRLGAPEAPAP